MKGFLLALVFLGCALSSQAKEYKEYRMLLEDTPVELADGAKWLMDKGDVFPVVMYKENQKKVILQLDTTRFMTEKARTRILEENEVAAGLENYRKNVDNYVKSQTSAKTPQVTAPPVNSTRPPASTAAPVPPVSPVSPGPAKP